MPTEFLTPNLETLGWKGFD